MQQDGLRVMKQERIQEERTRSCGGPVWPSLTRDKVRVDASTAGDAAQPRVWTFILAELEASYIVDGHVVAILGASCIC